jgi:hypothetical protein
MTLHCDADPFGEEGSDFEFWPPPNPDDYEYYESPDMLV